MNNKLTTKEFWVHGQYKFSRHVSHGIDIFIQQYIPQSKNGSCIEIGSYPGSHLPTFGDMGYKLNGIDFHPDNSKGLPAWLNSQNYKTGEFLSIDFFEFEANQKYEVVASFGFIEHFINYKDVIAKQASIVSTDGFLIITTPNFRGWIQYWLHNTFDKKNLALHNTESMNPNEWKKLLKASGFEIIYHGYFGGFWFWHGHEKLPDCKRKILWIIERLIPRIRKLLWFQSPAFSAYAGIVARKSVN
ncbi:MAG: methyltransferase domain-containing protein [Ginsengibacter sp.]